MRGKIVRVRLPSVAVRILLVVVLLLGSPFFSSCGLLRRHGEPFVSWDPETTIPFLVPDKTEDGTLYRLGTWDTDTGAVSLDDRVLFSASSECRIFWDGGDRLIAIPRDPGDASQLKVTVEDQRLTVLTPDVALRLPSGLHSLVAELPSGEGVACAYQKGFGETVLEVQGGPLEGKVQLVPPGLPPGSEVLGPVALDADSPSRIEAYVETVRSVVKDGWGSTLCSFFAATWDGAKVSWRTVAEDIEVNEAGPGSTFCRHGRCLAICDWRGTRLLELNTGEVDTMVDLNGAMEAFQQDNVEEVEFAAPPAPGGYRDFLLVRWSIPSVENFPDGSAKFIPTTYLAAVRDGRVFGEVKRVADRVWVEKDGKTIGEITTPPEVWILPR